MADNHSKLGEELLLAVNKGDTDGIECLLNKKADVNYRNALGQFPLLLASRKGLKEIVQRLIKGGAEVDLVGNHGTTSLSLASECGHHNTVEVLIERGANIDHPVGDGRTPLMLASQNGHAKTVQVLLTKKANVNLVERDYIHTALMIASKFGHLKVVDMLLPTDNTVDVQDENDITLLMLASGNGHVDTVDLLLQKGAQVDMRSSKYNGYTALLFACYYGYEKVVEKLVEKGAKVDLRTSSGHSALIIATERGYVQIVEVLLDHSAEVDLSLHQNRETALIIASKNCNVEIVELLLRGESQQQFQSPQVQSPEIKTVCKTRSRSADVNFENWNGSTALSFACLSGNIELVEILIQHGANVNPQARETPLFLATRHGYTGVVEVLLKNKANPNPYSRNVDNVPPLILATVLEYTEIVKALLKYNAEVDAVYGRFVVTPLMYAIFAGHFELVKLFCDRVANIHFESTPKLDCGVSKLSTDELANALGNHKITDILKSPLQTESEENACDSDDLEEIHPTKKLTVDNTSSVRVFTKETQEHFFSRIVIDVKREYDSIYRDYCGHSILTSSLLNRAYTNLSDLATA